MLLALVLLAPPLPIPPVFRVARRPEGLAPLPRLLEPLWPLLELIPTVDHDARAIVSCV